MRYSYILLIIRKRNIMKRWIKKHKNTIYKILKIMLLLLMFIFLILHIYFSLIIRNWGFTFFTNIVILIIFIIQFREIKQFKKTYQKIIGSILLTVIILHILYILLCDFLVLILTKPVFVIDSYKISNSEYLKTVSWEAWFEEKIRSETVEVQYERHFGLGIYCYSTILFNSELDSEHFSIPKNDATYFKEKLNLKKIYAELDKKPSFCGRNLYREYKKEEVPKKIPTNNKDRKEEGPSDDKYQKEESPIDNKYDDANNYYIKK